MQQRTKPRAGDYVGPAVLSHAFRPFFLLGSLYAGLSVLVWIPVFYGELSLHSVFAPRDWHVHEMLFGYLAAVIAGFLFTAIPNWTGRLPVRGNALLGLLVVWLAGRIVVLTSSDLGWLLAMVVDVSFLVVVAATALREILAGKNWRNLMVVGLIALLLTDNVAFHLEAHFHGIADVSTRAAIAIVVLLISLIGGRIIPSFTHNWLVRENPGRLPVSFGKPDMAIVALSALVLAFWAVQPDGRITAAALAAAAVLHVFRLARWVGYRTLGERLVLILHIGYAFIPVGFVLAAVAALGVIPASAGIHAWMVGAAGVMTLAVMTRASLGHTGRALTATRAIQAIYAAGVVAALSRICAVLEPSYGEFLLHLAAVAWATAFLGFAACFGSVLLKRVAPRVVVEGR
jgi:uncharacterized protein involved in response to NO